MLHVQHQTQVQQMGLLGGELIVVPHGVQEILRHRQAGLGPVQVEGLLVVIVPLGGEGVGHDDWEAGNELQRLEHLHRQGVVVRVGIVGVQRQHRPGQLVHHVVAGRLEDHVLGEVGGQLPEEGQDLAELLQRRRRGQGAEQQQIGRLLIAEAMLVGKAVDQILHVDAPVDQLAGHGDLLTVLHDVAPHVADLGHAGHDAGAVGIAQAPLHVVPLVVGRIDLVIFFKLSA